MYEQFVVTVGLEQFTMIRSVKPAGISGPTFIRPTPKNLDEVDEFFRSKGFRRIEPWRVEETCQGMALEAEFVYI